MPKRTRSQVPQYNTTPSTRREFPKHWEKRGVEKEEGRGVRKGGGRKEGKGRVMEAQKCRYLFLE